MPPSTSRRLMKFDPTVNTGTIIQIAVFVVTAVVAYGSYREEQTRQDGRITQLETSASTDRSQTKDALTDLRGDMKELQRSNQEIKESLAVLRGRTAEPGAKR